MFLFVCLFLVLQCHRIGLCEKTPQWQQKFPFRCIRWHQSSDNLWIFQLKLQELCSYWSKCQTSCLAHSPHSRFRHRSRRLSIIFSQFTIFTISLVTNKGSFQLHPQHLRQQSLCAENNNKQKKTEREENIHSLRRFLHLTCGRQATVSGFQSNSLKVTFDLTLLENRRMVEQWQQFSKRPAGVTLNYAFQ